MAATQGRTRAGDCPSSATGHAGPGRPGARRRPGGHGRHGGHGRPGGPARARHAMAGHAVAAACAAIMVLTGCAGRAGNGPAVPSLTVTSAYVPLPAATTPGTTVAFLDIRNDGGADQLIAARTSVGGTVTFRAPGRQNMRMMMTMTTVPAISIPAVSTVRLLPDDAHLLITGAGRMQGGKDITLILTFARTGTVSVTAQVTDPQSGGSSYFTN
jgi:copper(I)-binding protein